jgi:alanyl-tRNA synthetase
MGLERVSAVIQGHLSNYDTDLFTPLLSAIGERAGRRHTGTMGPADVSMRVVADHLRAMTFLIADGVVPSNKERGYALRKIMRRAMRHGKLLGMRDPFLHALVDTLVREFGGAYPELVSGRDAIVKIVEGEEERFDAVLTEGLPRLEEVLDRAASSGGVVPGDAAFRLYDTYGLPRDFIEDMIEERKLALDVAGFDSAMEGQREKARAGSAFKGSARAGTWQVSADTERDLLSAGDVFQGYDSLSTNAQILALFDARQQEIQELGTGAEGFVALSATPFYLEAGGQVSDVGTITGTHGDADVTAIARVASWPRLHGVHVKGGALHRRDFASVVVSALTRNATRRNHTATHLLHAALREVLGPHVKQSGSLVAPDRLRFDFIHPSALTPEQIVGIERIVNEQILRNTPVHTEVRSTQEAIAAGAIALFGEKYGDRVRVVSIPGFSMELCGGTHVHATGDIGLFVILAENGVAAGVRRIDAVTGLDSLEIFQKNRDEIARVATTLNIRASELTLRVGAVLEENRRLSRELQQVKLKAAMSTGTARQDEDVAIAGITLVAQEVTGLDREGLRALVDRHRDRVKSGVVVLAAPADGKVSVVVGVTPDLVKKVSAGQLVKQLAPIVGGAGGGRPDFAEAGGKDASRVAEMLAASRGVVEKMLSA